jgi:hypothetical protein
MKDKRLVLVEWVDSGEGRGWTPIEDIVREPMVCRSVGWLIHETEKGITVAAHYGSEEDGRSPQVCGDMLIPKVAVLSVKDLIVDTSPRAKTREVRRRYAKKKS